MSVPRPGSAQQPLLPAALEHSLSDLGIRITGGLFVAFGATSWLALISWQLRDPAAGTAVKTSRNLLGGLGAGLSDMLVQTIGIAAIFALICPMIWGLELLSNVRWIPRLRIKMLAAIGAVVALAGAASGLPQLPGWPLLGGSGGMLGDLVHNLFDAALSRHGMGKESFTATLVLLAAGLWLLAKSLGFKLLGLRLPPWLAFRRAAAPGDAAAVQRADETTSGIAQIEPVLPGSAIRATAPEHDEPLDDTEIETMADDKTRAFAERFAPGVATGKVSERPRFIPSIKSTLAQARSSAAYCKPSLNLLRKSRKDAYAQNEASLEVKAANLVDVLAAFGVKGEIKEARPGPVVTRYEFEPVRGTKISRIINLADDFARELGTSSVRVSTTPNRTTIGIEIPNERRDNVVLRDILDSEVYNAGQMQLPLALGKGIAGEPVVLDLARMPHLLVAGTTGSGKSVGLNSMILSLVFRLDPSELRLLLIDPKMLEMSQYDKIPHLLHPVITDPTEAILALEWAVSEMEGRYRRMAQQSTRNIEGFNAKARAAIASGVGLSRTVQTGFDNTTGRAIYERQQFDEAPMPYIVIVIDELADLMITAGKKIEGLIQRLAQKARAAGIHIVMATQRPSVDVVTGTIKANFPIRISFRVASKIDSRTIINEPGAEQLLGHGDMLLTSGSGHHLRVHGAYVGDEEIERVTEALRAQGEPDYVDLQARPDVAAQRSAAGKANGATAKSGNRDEIYAAAVEIVGGDRKVSSGHLHRRMGITEAAAAELITRMEREGLVGPANMLGRRAILIERQAKAGERMKSVA